MPELPPRRERRKLLEAFDGRLDRDDRLIRDTGNQFDIGGPDRPRLLGRGVECVVFEDPNSSQKVIAYSMAGLDGNFAGDPRLRARVQYWLHRIMNILFPNNFPKFHAVSGGLRPDDTFHSVRQRIHQGEPTNIRHDSRPITFAAALDSFSSPELPSPNLLDVVATMRGLGINLNMDSSSGNILSTPDGRQYYVDTIWALEDFLTHERELVAYMGTHGYEHHQIASVTAAIGRLRVIASEIERRMRGG